LIRLDKSIVEGLQDIVLVLEDQLRPLVLAELSLLVDILYRPELLFPTVAAAAAVGDTASVAVAAAACGVTGFINRYYRLHFLFIFILYSTIPFVLNLSYFCTNYFFPRLIKHTEQLLEEKEDKLCVKVLKTLQEMMAMDLDYGDKVTNLSIVFIIMT
jgi:inositol 1,4,5-triphosphate receptor type 1